MLLPGRPPNAAAADLCYCQVIPLMLLLLTHATARSPPYIMLLLTHATARSSP